METTWLPWKQFNSWHFSNYQDRITKFGINNPYALLINFRRGAQLKYAWLPWKRINNPWQPLNFETTCKRMQKNTSFSKKME